MNGEFTATRCEGGDLGLADRPEEAATDAQEGIALPSTLHAPEGDSREQRGTEQSRGWRSAGQRLRVAGDLGCKTASVSGLRELQDGPLWRTEQVRDNRAGQAGRGNHLGTADAETASPASDHTPTKPRLTRPAEHLLARREKALGLLDLVPLGDFHDEEDYEGDDYECKEGVCEVSHPERWHLKRVEILPGRKDECNNWEDQVGH
jgi:hypothetical protein